MTSFNTNMNAFFSAIHQIKTAVHAFTVSGIAKGSKNAKQQKKSLINNTTNAIEHIETDDFGIRIIIIKTKD